MNIRAAGCAVILVNYNNAQDTLACLGALQKLTELPAHVVVVDNASRPDELQKLRDGWGKLTGSFCENPAASPLPANILLTLPQNTGFSGGNNAALRVLLASSPCSAFWILNNDTEPTPDALHALCQRLNNRSDAGMCGSTLVFSADKRTVQCSAGAALSLWTGATHFLCSQEGVSQVRHRQAEEVERQLGEITGASVLMPRHVIEKIGLMDESYFLYREDSEWSLRCRKHGFTLAWAPESIVFHKEGGSSGAHSMRKNGNTAHLAPQKSALVDFLSLRNRVFLIRTYAPWALPVVFVSFAGVCLNRIRRGQANRLPLILRAAWHGLLGRMGCPDFLK